jgi:plasmid maintenance system antidote protein VapI
MDLTHLVSDFRSFVNANPDFKKAAFAKAIGVSPSGLSAILNGTNNPSASTALLMLNVLRNGSTKILHLQENGDLITPHGNPNQRIELNDRNAGYLENFSRRYDCTLFDTNAGRVAREGADDDPADDGGDVTTVRKASDMGTDDPSLENVFRQLDNLYPQMSDVLRQIGSIIKALPNKTGNTEPARRTTDNADSRKAGPRQPKFS